MRTTPRIESQPARMTRGMVSTIADAAVAVARCDTVDEVVQAIFSQLVALGASAALLYAGGSQPDSLRLLGQWNVSDRALDELRKLPLSHDTLAGLMADPGAMIVVEDVAELDQGREFALAVEGTFAAQSVVGVPIRAHGSLVGMLFWGFPVAHRFNADERAAIVTLADVFGLALARAYLHGHTTPPHGLAATTPSLTEQRLIEAVGARGQVEIELRERERRLRAMLDHSAHFAGLLDTRGCLLEANHTALKFAGVTRDEVLGRPFGDTPWWTEPAERERLADGIRRAAQGETVKFETMHVGRDGRALRVDFSLSPVHDETGVVVLLVAEGVDITAHKDLERYREEWTSVVAHDLRQPVGAIALWTKLMDRHTDDSPPALREAMHHVRSAVGQLDRMIADLLDASQVEAGRLVIRQRQTHLPSLVRAVIARAPIPADRTVELHLDPRVDCADVDAGRVEQVLLNLLSNAVKYGRAGSPIRVEATCDSERVQIAVANRGDGIAREEIPSLFQRFKRTHVAAAGRTPGIGLGLYIARGLVEAHGGRIGVTSTPGDWTAFTLSLPIRA